MKKKIVWLFLMIGVIYLGIKLTNGKDTRTDSSMNDLDSIESLKQDFNKSSGKVRIVTLLSPT